MLFNTVLLASVRAPETSKSIYDIEKPMGEVRTRFNIIEQDRTPLTEFPLKQINARSYAPNRIRRGGLIPRITIMEEYNDNILFLPENKIADIITIVSPGINFAHDSKRGQFEFDYSFESTIFSHNSNFNQAFETHNLLVTGSYQLGKNSLLSLSNSFFSFKDTANQVIPGTSLRSRIYENFFNTFLSHSLSKNNNLIFGYNQTLNSFDDKSLTNSLIHDVNMSLSTVLTPQDVIEVEYRFRSIDFELQSAVLGTGSLTAPDGGIHFFSIKNTHDFSETWTLSGKLGIAEITKPISTTSFIASIALTKSIKDSIFEIRYGRDFSTIGGFNTLLQSDTVSTSVKSSLVNRLYGILQVNLSRFRQLSSNGITVQMVEPSVALEYKLSTNFQFRFSYYYLYQQTGAGNTDGNKLNLGLIASF